MRSIPACAGETPRRATPRSRTRVYPRVCGGNTVFRPTRHDNGGLSPRVRGKHLDRRCRPLPRRSIPACAGETGGVTHIVTREGVYPRVCGGNPGEPWLRAGGGGLSPRVRGKRQIAAGAPGAAWSIPACAGETTCSPFNCAGVRVYPRVCGGNVCAVALERSAGGLSPRVRGKPVKIAGL